MALGYRAEIDGLRALAVIPVILFHAGFEAVGGGFVGVDVFFVISGYLITRLILADIDQGKFSLLDFYERRARRILPALFFVTAACVPVAMSWFAPRDLKDFGESVVAVVTFVSNFLFWHQSGYFDGAAELKPLLHTWSLAVEEQYYVIYPLLLVAIWPAGRRVRLAVLIAIFVVSLGISYLAHTDLSTEKLASASFYLLPARCWELLLGGFAAIYLRQPRLPQLSRSTAEIFGISGIGLIVFAMLAFDERTPFPSVYALVPAVGALLIILAPVAGTLTNRMLSSPPFVSMGLISYSAYLWHQPIFAFAKYGSFDGLSDTAMTALVGASLVVAWLSYHLIERPFRTPAVKRNAIFAGAVASSVVLLVIGAGIASRDFSDRLYAADDVAWDAGRQLRNPNIILYGDSHSKHFYHALEVRGQVRVIAEPACMALPGIVNQYQGKATERSNCLSQLSTLTDALANADQPVTVVFAFSWNKKLVDSSSGEAIGDLSSGDAYDVARAKQALFASLERFVTEDLGRHRLVLIGNVPGARSAGKYMQYGYDKCRTYFGAECPDRYPNSGNPTNRQLSEFAEKHDNVIFLDPYKSLCDQRSCFVLADGKLLYSDHAHLTRYGAERAMRLFPKI